MIVLEHVREAFGQHVTDRRRTKTHLQQHYPLLQFDENMTNDDALWSAEWRESIADVQARIQKALNWIVRRPEDLMVVVTHGVWMEVLLQRHLSEQPPERRRVYNCQAYACQVISSQRIRPSSMETDVPHFVRLQSVQQIYDGR
jgi:broad specificity phosphatase PhoE